MDIIVKNLGIVKEISQTRLSDKKKANKKLINVKVWLKKGSFNSTSEFFALTV